MGMLMLINGNDSIARKIVRVKSLHISQPITKNKFQSASPQVLFSPLTVPYDLGHPWPTHLLLTLKHYC